MKKMIFLSLLLAGLIVIPAIAQEEPEAQAAPQAQGGGAQTADFGSPTPQFLSFSFGVPIGYSQDVEEVVAGFNFSLCFAVMDNLTIGFDRFSLQGPDSYGYTWEWNANLLRVTYAFAEAFGAAIGFGTLNGEAAANLGVFANLFQARAANGLAYSLGLRVDYLAATSDFTDGVIVFTIRASFGL